MTTATPPAGYTYAREYDGYDIYTPDDAGDLTVVVGHQDGYTVVDTSGLTWSDMDDLCGAAIAAMHADDGEEGATP